MLKRIVVCLLVSLVSFSSEADNTLFSKLRHACLTTLTGDTFPNFWSWVREDIRPNQSVSSYFNNSYATFNSGLSGDIFVGVRGREIWVQREFLLQTNRPPHFTAENIPADSVLVGMPIVFSDNLSRPIIAIPFQNTGMGTTNSIAFYRIRGRVVESVIINTTSKSTKVELNEIRAKSNNFIVRMREQEPGVSSKEVTNFYETPDLATWEPLLTIDRRGS